MIKESGIPPPTTTNLLPRLHYENTSNKALKYQG